MASFLPGDAGAGRGAADSSTIPLKQGVGASPAPQQGTQFPKKGSKDVALMAVATPICTESKSGFEFFLSEPATCPQLASGASGAAVTVSLAEEPFCAASCSNHPPRGSFLLSLPPRSHSSLHLSQVNRASPPLPASAAPPFPSRVAQ